MSGLGPGSVRLVYGESPSNVQAFSLDTAPAGQASCGRVTFTNLHTVSGDPPADFPDGCTSTSLSPQELALMYLIFDLGACL